MTETQSTGLREMTRSEKIVLVVLVVSVTVMILNETTLSVALPSIMKDFDITAATAQWLTTGFLLTMAVVIPTTGYLIERLTTRQVFTTAFVFFLSGTLVAAVAPTFLLLLLGRVLQAASTSLVMPLLMTTVMTVVPPHRRGAVMGLIPIVISLAPAMGPTVSGLILRFYTWHYIFWFMVPVAAATMLAGWKWISNIGETRNKPLDFLSVVLAAFGFGGLVYGLSSIDIIMTGGGLQHVLIGLTGLVIVAIFAKRQFRLAQEDKALLDLRVFQQPSFGLSIVLMMILFGLYLGMVTILPIYLQDALLQTTVISGLVVMPGGLVQAVASPFVGRLYDKFGPKPLIIPGSLILLSAVIALAALTHFGRDPQVVVIITACLFGCTALGLALSMTPLFTASLGVLPQNLYGHGSAALSTLEQLAGAVGIALLVAMLTQGINANSDLPLVDATRVGTTTAFLVGTVLGVAAVVVAVLIKFPAKSD
jgi:hypothetical protein